ncbi:RsmE family RNA methyltransferase [Lacicoccus alkaliphilus]|uniref:Ribosomal RNA small subunit methyltransferase E n=1 Tax=Lacicoccus alkaliphilus DSM 16010 TaxID=1123231 RepID=A0A1M7BMH5_9BACL|nr:16S rRNA (uracil(1498)-N(3))-methyltransferase [Salinicoccus alkaliphilus]SHL56123.1 16S rRNA (uracil1498-N3)-methyltransferase [Salinicoccus alkaliphilus DSM 16010]
MSETLNLNEKYEIDNEDTHHMINVMRFRVDDAFEMIDGTTTGFVCRITGIEGRKVAFLTEQVLDSNTESPVGTTIICPLLKGEKFEWMLQKSTELGAVRFIIYEADRSIVKLDDKKRGKRLARFQKVIREASEQSRRFSIPEIHFEGRLKNVDFSDYDSAFIAFEGYAGQKAVSFKNLGGVETGKKIAFIFGPEGGLTEDEVEADASFTPLSLGPRILRAETAPLYFLAAVSSLHE